MFWAASEQLPVPRPGPLASPRNGRFPREGEIRTGATDRGVEVRENGYENRSEYAIKAESAVFSHSSLMSVLTFPLLSLSQPCLHTFTILYSSYAP